MGNDTNKRIVSIIYIFTVFAVFLPFLPFKFLFSETFFACSAEKANSLAIFVFR